MPCEHSSDPVGRQGRVAAALLSCVLAVGACARAQPSETRAETSLGELSVRLSESGGYFDTDNLVSNERSFVQVLDRLQPRGGAFIGVGPDQNYNYIGRLRPEWAFIVDLRPDNRLHHLLLIAVLVQAETPYEYLCWLFARAPRAPGQGQEGESLDATIERFEASPTSEAIFARQLTRLEETISNRFGMELTEGDLERLRTIYAAFQRDQLEIRFRSHGRPSMSHYPTYRSLLEARTPEGSPAHFLARPDDYRHLRELALSGRLVPVVGDFGGSRALTAVGAFLKQQGVTVTAFYTSNVEYYLFGSERYRSFVENVRSLPIDGDSLFVRACFDYGRSHPERLPGYRSTMLLQHIEGFLELWDAGQYRSYWDLCIRDYLGAAAR